MLAWLQHRGDARGTYHCHSSIVDLRIRYKLKPRPRKTKDAHLIAFGNHEIVDIARRHDVLLLDLFPYGDDGEDARAFLDLVVEQDAAFAGSDLTNDITLEIFFHGLDDSCRYTSGSEESNLDARKADEDSMAKGTHSTF